MHLIIMCFDLSRKPPNAQFYWMVSSLFNLIQRIQIGTNPISTWGFTFHRRLTDRSCTTGSLYPAVGPSTPLICGYSPWDFPTIWNRRRSCSSRPLAGRIQRKRKNGRERKGMEEQRYVWMSIGMSRNVADWLSDEKLWASIGFDLDSPYGFPSEVFWNAFRWRTFTGIYNLFIDFFETLVQIIVSQVAGADFEITCQWYPLSRCYLRFWEARLQLFISQSFFMPWAVRV